MLSGTGRKISLICMMLIVFTAGAFTQSLSLTAELDREQIWLGDSVQLTLFLKGSEDAISPKLQIADVKVEPLGGTVRSSKSVTNINGKVTQNISKAYIYGYKLTPEITGKIMIPSIDIVVDGVKLSSPPLSLDVKQPMASDDFKLQLEFDRNKVYLNEECRLKISFKYARSLRSLEIMIPGLSSLHYETSAAAGGDDSYDINVNGSPVVFTRDDSDNEAGLSAELIIKAAESGEISLQNSSASFESVTGYQRVKDFWGRVQNQEVYGRTVIPGSQASITVLPFPEEGQPDDFFGLSGLISVDMSIEPYEVHIGDPITLQLKISGMNSTDVKIPRLENYLGSGIDVPDTRSSDRIEGSGKTITQTVRIKDKAVQQIPSIRLSYFNTQTERYEYAESGAVPVKVLETKVLTVSELEGADDINEQPEKIIMEKKHEGIYYSYSGDELLEPGSIMVDRLTESILIKVLLLIPPSIYIIILIYTVLLPQVRAKAEIKADRRRAVKNLKKYAGKASVTDTTAFLKDFNTALKNFLKIHGSTDDENQLKEIIGIINSVLYGRAEISPDDARKAAINAVEILQRKEVQND